MDTFAAMHYPKNCSKIFKNVDIAASIRGNLRSLRDYRHCTINWWLSIVTINPKNSVNILFTDNVQ